MYRRAVDLYIYAILIHRYHRCIYINCKIWLMHRFLDPFHLLWRPSFKSWKDSIKAGLLGFLLFGASKSVINIEKKQASRHTHGKKCCLFGSCLERGNFPSCTNQETSLEEQIGDLFWGTIRLTHLALATIKTSQRVLQTPKDWPTSWTGE